MSDGPLLCEGAGGSPRLLPYERTRDYRKPAETIPRSKGHHRDWLDATKGGKPASSNFDYAARLTELVLLGIASLRTGRKLHWDAENMKATGPPRPTRSSRSPVARDGKSGNDRCPTYNPAMTGRGGRPASAAWPRTRHMARILSGVGLRRPAVQGKLSN